MRPGLGRGLDSLLKVYDNEVIEEKKSKNETVDVKSYSDVQKIDINNGVCGYSARNKQSIIVDNVHEFEGHIACDSNSNSELVIPIIINNKLYGVLDIDSPIFNRFSKDDLLLFESIVDYISIFLK